DGRTLTFAPNGALSVNRSHTIYMFGIKDLFGNAMSQTISFTTGYAPDSNAPQILSTSIQDGEADVPTNAVLAVRVNEPVSTMTLGNIQLLQGTTAVSATRALSNDHSIVYLQVAQPLQAGTAYTFSIANVQDLSGNVLASNLTVNFTTTGGPDS